MKKITITNAYTWYNKGDAGILLGIINTLKEFYKNDVEFKILSFTPDEDKKRYCKDSTINDVYSNVLNPRPYKHTKIGKFYAIIKLFFRMIYLWIMLKFGKEKLVNSEESFKAMEESDIIVVCGGGFLGGKKFDSLMHLFQIYANTKFNKPVIIMGTSIEPIKNKIIKRYTEKVLKKVDYVYAREKITFDYLKSFMDKDKYALIPDMAFMLEDKKEKSQLIDFKKDNNILIGITVRKWNFPNSENPKKSMENYINAVTKCMEKNIKEKNAIFVFIPQVIVEYGDDTLVAKEIKKRITNENKDKFIILEEDLSPVELKTTIWNLDYFIGTRMHSNIFATTMGVPTVAIAYEKKTNGIMQTVGLDKYIVEIDEITEEKLEEKLDELIQNNEEIRKRLDKKIIEIREKIKQKIEIVFKNI